MSKPETPFFSIIVPVYNASSRLEVLVKGLQSQVCKDFEVILVDDKSTDNSLELLMRIADKHANFYTIKMKENGGAGPARNLGVKHAKGQYLIFHDADDWLKKDALKALKRHIESHSYPDMTIYQYHKFNERKELISKEVKSMLNLPIEMDGTFVFNAICEAKINLSTWNKAFKRSTWGELKFQHGYMYEDLAFIPYACLQMNTVTYCHDAIYCYYFHTGGITFDTSDRQALAPYQALTGLRELLDSMPNAASYQLPFLRLAIHHFHHNFFYLERNRVFTDSQVMTYKSMFLQFCKENSITVLQLIGSQKALLLLEGLLIEKRARNLDWDAQLTLTLSEVEEIVDHLLVISRQFDLAMLNAGELADVQGKWLKKENRMKRRIKKLEDNIFYKLGNLLGDWTRSITGK